MAIPPVLPILPGLAGILAQGGVLQTEINCCWQLSFSTASHRRSTADLAIRIVRINRHANLYELRAHRQSVGMSVRLAKGVYVGKRHYISKDHLDKTAVGTVILTDQRLVFVSPAKTVTAQIANIISAQAGGDCLQIHSEKRQRPIILEFPAAQLAALLIAVFLKHPFQENTLPNEMAITATPTASRDGVTLSFKTANEPSEARTRH
jgi:hypothetical protein